jgi:hypothetical protein
MQALVWDALLAWTKLGMAMAASRPITATTNIISTNVNPRLQGVYVFMLVFSH